MASAQCSKDQGVAAFTSVLRGLAQDLKGLVAVLESSPSHARSDSAESPKRILTRSTPEALLTRIERSADPVLEICIDAYLLGSEISGDPEIFTSHVALLDEFPAGNFRSTDAATGACALHFAAGSGSESLARKLLDRKFPIDVRDKNLRTPLFWACAKNKICVARLLISAGADLVKTLNAEKNTPLHVAAFYGHCEIFDLIGNSCVDVRGRLGRTPLHVAAARGHAACARKLLETGADPRLQDARGMHCMHHAGTSGNAELFRELLRELSGKFPDLARERLAAKSPLSALSASWVPGNGKVRDHDFAVALSPKRVRRAKPEIVAVRWDEVCLRIPARSCSAELLQVEVMDCATKCVRRQWLKNCDFQTDGEETVTFWFPVAQLPRNRRFAFKTPDSAWSDAAKFPIRTCVLCKAATLSEQAAYCQLHFN